MYGPVVEAARRAGIRPGADGSMDVFVFWPGRIVGSRSRHCVEVRGLVRGGSVNVWLCGPGLGPELVDWFFAYRQASLERFVSIDRRGDDRVYVVIDPRAYPLQAHFLLAVIGSATLRSRGKRKKVAECYGQLDPLEPVSPRLYEVVDEVLSAGGRPGWKRLSRLSRCVRCWCGVD